MNTLRRVLVPLLVLAAFAPAVSGQPSRPVPYPVFLPPQFAHAIENGTRTLSGAPGPNYWQNEAAYDFEAEIDTTTKTLTASGSITYRNNSPSSLPYLVLKLRQNVHAEGVPRNRYVAVTGGVALSALTHEGTPLTEVTNGQPEAGQYQISGTILTLALPEPLPSGGEVTLDVAWSYPIPPHTGAFRQGQDGEVYYLGYWYPQVAVYDDVYGWHTDQYLGLGEHYMGWADYDVAITVPEGMLVWATGDLTNPTQVLAPEAHSRLIAARTASEPVQIVAENQRRAGLSTLDAEDDRLTWLWRAENVRDFALSASDQYVWDATYANVDQDGDGTTEPVLINAFYRPGVGVWERSAEFSKFSIEHLSELLFPYPYPHMTAVEGLIGGGIEYPMMTLIGGRGSAQSLFGVTYHEVSHMWFPMIVGTNEKAFTWMDEGMTNYNTNVGRGDFFDGSAEDRPEVDAWARSSQYHYYLAGTGYAVEPMRHNDLYPLGGGTNQVDPIQNASRVVAGYSTPAVLLHAIEGIYGRERFLDAYRTYARRWAFKHPYPYDLFDTFEDVLGDDLDWLWTPTLFETWTVDHGILGVEEAPDAVRVTVVDYGLAPMPVPVTVTYADGTTEQSIVPVQTWLDGARQTVVTLPPGDAVQVTLDPEDFTMDVDRTNNTWTDESEVNSGG